MADNKKDLSESARKVEATLIPRIMVDTDENGQVSESLGYHGPEDLVTRSPRITYDAIMRWLQSQREKQSPGVKL